MPKTQPTEVPENGSAAGAAPHGATKKPPLAQKILPAYSLQKSLLIAKAIVDHFGGKSGEPTAIALAIGWAPTGGSWRMLCSSSVAYGLTEGGYSANEIKLTALGSAIVAPTEEGAEKAAMLQALTQPSVIKTFVDKYNKQKYPAKDIAINVLDKMGIPRDRGGAAYDLLTENFTALGALRDSSSGKVLLIDPNAIATKPIPAIEEPSSDLTGTLQETLRATTPATPPSTAKKQFFLAHGSDSEALTQLKAMLQELHIPFVVAVDEPHAGRPISEKVAQLMRESSGGLFIFSGDEKAVTADGKTEKRPRMNVVFELGAASLLYGKRIVIFKESDVVVPSDFSDLGYIEYERGQLRSKTLDLLKELVKLGALQVLPEA